MTEKDNHKNKLIHQLVEDQVQRTPDQISVIFEEQKITYLQLNEKANQLAHYLCSIGIVPEQRVIIAIERSLEMLISLLAILKVGAVYVPLDPNQPQDRLAFFLNEINATIVITKSRFKKKIIGYFGKKLFLSTDSTSSKLVAEYLNPSIAINKTTNIYKQSNENLKARIALDSLAYVIYTSGSTRSPKGVMISHRSVLGVIEAIQDKIQITSKDTWLALTAITFDISVLEIFLSLIKGALIVLLKEDDIYNPAEIIKKISQHNVTIIQTTPSMWEVLSNETWPDNKIKILTGGKVLTKKLYNKLKKIGHQIVNVYGPTETTIWSTITILKNKSASVYSATICQDSFSSL